MIRPADLADPRTALALLGSAAALSLAARLARVLWLRAQIALGPVKVYKGEWALVTGASEGIGKAVAASLAAHGMHVVLVSRSQDKLATAKAEIQAQSPGVQVRTIACDVSKPEACARLLQQVADTPISVLVANAGGAAGKIMVPFWERSDSDDAAVRDLNGTHTLQLTRGLLPGMIERGHGAVVGISSLMHKLGPFACAYGSEKAKINAVMDALDGELAVLGHHGVTAQSMVIGGVLTPATLKLRRPGMAAATPAEVAAALAEEAASRKRGLMKAPAADVGEAIVRSIGKGGPLVTPYWGHWLPEVLLLDAWWPPALQRAVKRRIVKYMLQQLALEQAADAAAAKQAA